MTDADRAVAKVIKARSSDWRNGAIVYHVFVDRFAPSDHLADKQKYYAAPRTLQPWTQVPTGGHPVPEAGVYSHELAFWGGDLKSVQAKLDYLHDLGADVVYLNPIPPSVTNHRYDAFDYAEVAPEYGTRQDVADLANGLHAKGMKLMLDGAFNHMSKNSPRFKSAIADPKSPFRDWFFIDKKYPNGYRSWVNIRNLPELKIENAEVQKYLWASPDSVVQKYLKEGVDGWRLDTAYELGTRYLGELTQAAHHAKPGSVVVGEVWNYPAGWFPAMDGVMNFHIRQILLDTLSGRLSPLMGNRLLERMVADSGLDHLLKSWIILDNHDTDRLKSMLPDDKQRHLAQVLQFTLPGCPLIYYGAEVGMEGRGDPGSRGPMRWDMVTESNPDYAWMKKLVALRKSHLALRVGDFSSLESEHLLAFSRTTEKALDTVIVLANPTNDTVKEAISCRDGRIMNGGRLKDLLDGSTTQCFSGFIHVQLPPHSARVYEVISSPGYTPYKRIY